MENRKVTTRATHSKHSHKQLVLMSMVHLRVFQTPDMRWILAFACAVAVTLSAVDCGSRAESSEWTWGKGRDRSSDSKTTGKATEPYWLRTAQPSLKKNALIYPFNKFPAFPGIWKVHYRTHNCHPQVHILSQVRPVLISSNCGVNSGSPTKH
jgi:hypothetical protein